MHTLAQLATSATQAQTDFLTAHSALAIAIDGGFTRLVVAFDAFADARERFRSEARATGLDARDVLDGLDVNTSGITSNFAAIDGDEFTGKTPLEFPQNATVSRLLAALLNTRTADAHSAARNARLAQLPANHGGEFSSTYDLVGTIPTPRAQNAQPLPPEPARIAGPGPLAQAILDAHKGGK